MESDIDAFLRSLDLLEAPSLSTSINEQLSSPTHGGGGGGAAVSRNAASTAAAANGHRSSRRTPVVAAAPHTRTNAQQPSDSSKNTATEKENSSSPTTTTTTAGTKRRRTASAFDAAVEEKESLGAGWVCSVCTLLNAGASVACEACGMARNRTESSGGWVCAKCGYANPNHSASHCSNCKSLATRTHISQSPSTYDTKVDGTVNKPSLEAPDKSSSSGSSSAVVEVDDEVVDDATAALRAEDEEEEGSEGSGSDSDSDLSSSSEMDALHETEVVDFLRTLNAVAHEHLPHADVPPSMAAKGELRPFQRQALHWMLEREGRVRPNSVGHSALGGRGEDESVLGLNSEHSMNSSHEPFGNSFSSHDPSDSATEQQKNICAVKGGILADFMGLGKTRTTIALCEATRGRRFDRVHGNRVLSPATLVVCPASLLLQWKREIQECVTPQPKVLLYYGSTKKRLSLFQVTQDYDYVLTSYQTLRHEFYPRIQNDGGSNSHSPDVRRRRTACTTGAMAMTTWQRIVLDEAHHIRNMRTKQCSACLQLDGVYRWVMTGTPVMNHLSDLFPLLQFLRVPHFGSRMWWNANIVSALNEAADNPRAVAALKLLFSSLLLRRTPQSTVGGERILMLPEKTISITHVALNREERDFYDAVHSNAAVKLDAIVRRNTNVSAYTTAFEMLLRCRQACLHPYIVVAALQARQRQRQGLSAEPGGGGGGSGGLHQATEAVAVNATGDMIKQFMEQVAKKLRTQGEFVAELLEQVQNQELDSRECIICLDTMARPTILPCAHTFCEDCISHALEVNQCCPLCKRKTKKNEILVVPEEVTSKQAPGPDLSSIAVDDSQTWMRSTKVLALLEAIRAIPPDEKIIVFSTFVTFLNYVKHCLDQEQISSVMYTGALNMQKKEEVLRKFRGAATSDGAGPRVLLATITACGVGLNLTCASRCFMMEPSWNPGIEEQAMNRIHRIGQTRPVHIVKFLARETVEEKIEQLNALKKALSGYCFDDAAALHGVTNTRRLGKDELLALFDVSEGSSDDGDDDDDSSDFHSLDSDSEV